MRISGAFFITILLAVGYMLYLTARDATSSLDAIAVVATDLREQGVEGRALDRELALQMVAAMEDLLAATDTIPQHIEDLKTFAATAAAWADAAPSPSPELRGVGPGDVAIDRPPDARSPIPQCCGRRPRVRRHGRVRRPWPRSRNRRRPRSDRQPRAIAHGTFPGAR